MVFGLKEGISAYAYHARELGARDEEVDAFVHDAMFFTLTNVDFNLERHIEMVMKCGQLNYRVMSNVLKVLQDNFNLQLISTADEDLKVIFGTLPESNQIPAKSDSLLARIASWFGLK